MVREIKFRCWNHGISKMYPVWGFNPRQIQWANEDGSLGGSFSCGKTSKKKFEILQFTGLIDKNGSDIFQGDILEYYDMIGEFHVGGTDRMVVEWHEKFARFGLSFWSIYGGEGYTGSVENIHEYVNHGAVVIGNIYENKYFLLPPPNQSGNK